MPALFDAATADTHGIYAGEYGYYNSAFFVEDSTASTWVYAYLTKTTPTAVGATATAQIKELKF